MNSNSFIRFSFIVSLHLQTCLPFFIIVSSISFLVKVYFCHYFNSQIFQSYQNNSYHSNYHFSYLRPYFLIITLLCLRYLFYVEGQLCWLFSLLWLHAFPFLKKNIMMKIFDFVWVIVLLGYFLNMTIIHFDFHIWNWVTKFWLFPLTIS